MTPLRRNNLDGRVFGMCGRCWGMLVQQDKHWCHHRFGHVMRRRKV
ncbi:MAG: hypothetical protein RMM08_00655 [Armatimonadota bacterium]|nr:hypothetical protein [bacterium]MDW8319845.1 hypothetical protein [Armatimonadota bacterium]